ncbi:c-type cytochrome [Kordiimonas aquimaris]|uniref:c-type cytochrome n=1 Tax=Kordiimonas aquimaris TaxID=707591 RepID=UPI0021D124BE|nr:cytochrome c [Kordiimonas aquimaris]
MTFSTLSKTALIALMVGASFASTTVSAQSGKQKRFAESQYRHDNMEHVKYALANIVQILKGEASHEGHLPKLAAIMASSASMAKATFEKDTRGMSGHTEAKDAIWENWADFSSKMDTFEADTAALAKVAETGDMGQFGAAFQKATGNCKSCHDKYKD